MKNWICYNHLILLVAVGCLSSACQSNTTSAPGGSTTTASTADAAQLTINRAPNLGEILVITIDGGQKSTVRVGDSFKTTLAPGSHVISALLEPNQLNLAPTKKTLEVKKDQSYTLTAAWEGDTLVLR